MNFVEVWCHTQGPNRFVQGSRGVAETALLWAEYRLNEETEALVSFRRRRLVAFGRQTEVPAKLRGPKKWCLLHPEDLEKVLGNFLLCHFGVVAAG